MVLSWSWGLLSCLQHWKFDLIAPMFSGHDWSQCGPIPNYMFTAESAAKLVRDLRDVPCPRQCSFAGLQRQELEFASRWIILSVRLSNMRALRLISHRDNTVRLCSVVYSLCKFLNVYSATCHASFDIPHPTSGTNFLNHSVRGEPHQHLAISASQSHFLGHTRSPFSSASPLSPSIAFSFFHSRLKTHLFHKSFLP